MARLPVLAICGSLRGDSLHRGLLRAIESRAPGFQLLGEELVSELPLMDPDLDTPDRMPSAAREFRLLAEACSAAVIASPEYVHSASGVTKNALDWVAGSTGLYGSRCCSCRPHRVRPVASGGSRRSCRRFSRSMRRSSTP